MIPALVHCVFAVTQSVTESSGASPYSTRTVYTMTSWAGTQRLVLTHGQYIFGLRPGERAYVCGAPARSDRFTVSFPHGTPFGPEVSCDLGTASSVQHTESGTTVYFSTVKGARSISLGNGPEPTLGERGWLCGSKYGRFYQPANADDLARGLIGPFTIR